MAERLSMNYYKFSVQGKLVNIDFHARSFTETVSINILSFSANIKTTYRYQEGNYHRIANIPKLPILKCLRRHSTAATISWNPGIEKQTKKSRNARKAITKREPNAELYVMAGGFYWKCVTWPIGSKSTSKSKHNTTGIYCVNESIQNLKAI